jgi:hypothetical protein
MKAELRGYLLYLENEKRVSNSTFTVYLCGIQFFHKHTLERELPNLEVVRGRKDRKYYSPVTIISLLGNSFTDTDQSLIEWIRFVRVFSRDLSR